MRSMLVLAALLAACGGNQKQTAGPAAGAGDTERPTIEGSECIEVADCVKSCEAGNAPDCINAGWSYESGDGVALDLDRAVSLYGIGCRAGSVEACVSVIDTYRPVGSLRVDTDSARTNLAEVAKRLDTHCHADDADACDALGNLLTANIAPVRDDAAGLAAYEKGCALGSASSCTSASDLIDDARGAERDSERRRVLLTRACELEEAFACDDAASLTTDPTAAEALRARKVSLFQARCDKDPKFCWLIAGVYAATKDLESQARAEELYRVSCDAGGSYGCSALARFVEKNDPKRAAELLRKSCELGTMGDCHKLAGLLHAAGKKAEAEPLIERVVASFEKGCAEDMAYDCERLADLLTEDRLLPADRKRARELYNRTFELWMVDCNAGDPLGCEFASDLILDGKASGGRERAFELRERSCEQGDEMVCADLSERYFNGDGVRADPAKGQELRDRACKLGDSDACEPRPEEEEDEEEYD